MPPAMARPEGGLTMERLTKRLSNGATSWNYQSDCYGEDETRNKVFRSVHRQNACEKLAAYEDTGLEPEDIKRAFNEAAVLKLAGQALGITPDRLRELAQADKEGRCVVLPCKIGDTVYHIAKCRDFSKVLDGTLYDSNGGYGTATGYYCPCELADNCPFDDDSFDCDANKNKPNIFEDTVESVNIDDYEQYLRLDYSGAVSLEDFGKTVFLTGEEAEAALEGMKDAD